MYERLDNCPLCNSGHFHNKIITKDYTVSGESFAIVECDNCKLNYTNPRPSEKDINSFYESEDYISHSDETNSIYDLAYKIVRHFTLKSKLRLLNSFETKKTLLDYGCGTGNFLSVCKNSGWQIQGVEPNEKARDLTSNLTGEVIHSNILDIDPKQQFHVITLWHVLEHIHDLKGIMKQLKKRLKKRGYMLIAVPNNMSWDAKHYKEYWAGYDVPRHLYHFNPESFERLAQAHNLKIMKTIPQKMDSYYVSLLSEKYKHSANKPVRAILNGLLSNRNATKSNLYSSLVYVLRQ